jgi:asparagine synthase (glutamine-hydrolysing)
MCGVAGVLGGVGGANTSELIGRYVDALVHRGPDLSAQHLESPVALGHRRLSIIDLSPLGAQPMHSESGRWVIVYNGELYNHRQIREQLASDGVRFRGHSDTETLVEAIDRWGVERTLRATNGMFAFAAWDRQTETLVLARDRLGEKPLYWTNEGGRLLFASELKAFRALPDFRPDIDPAAVNALLRWSFIPHPHTIYRGVHQLSPGHLIEARLRDGRVETTERQWWSLQETVEVAGWSRHQRSVRDAAEELRPLLADAVALRMESDVPLGSFLSGGIDSSLVAAFAQQALGGEPLHTFTVKMPELGFDESVHAAAVAKHLGTRHTSVEMPLQSVLDAVPTLATVWDEPFADPSMLPSLLLCRAARKELTVCLAGDGGDEVFAGYNRHALGSSLWHKVGWLPGPVRRGIGKALLAPSPSTYDRWGNRIGRALPERLRLPNIGDKVQKAATVMGTDQGGLWASLAQIWPAESLPGPAWPTPSGPVLPGLDPIEQMMLTDTAVVLPDQMLVKVDRASMASSLEVRSPFLDHRLLEWSWRQPLDVKTKGGVGKLVLREVLDGLVPPAIVDRPKMGFDPPLATWLRGPLRDWAGDLVHSSRAVSNGWLDGASLERTWADHQSATRNFDYRLWAVLMLESWLQQHG